MNQCSTCSLRGAETEKISSQMIYQNFAVKVYGFRWQELSHGMNGLKVQEKSEALYNIAREG